MSLPEDHSGEVFCVGLAIRDVILTVDAIPTQPMKYYARNRREIGGGPAATASVAIARLGGHAVFAGRLGGDSVGETLRQELESEGVDTCWVRTFADCQSPSSVIVVDRTGDRAIIAYADPTLPNDADWLRPQALGGCVLCDLSWPAGAMKIMGLARRMGVPSVLDADVSPLDRSEIEPLVEAADYVIFSRQGLAHFANTDDINNGLRQASRSAHALVAVTDGPNGMYQLTPNGISNSRPPAVAVVDTTGAGDAFHGAFALALSLRWPVATAIKFSHAVAALKCSRPNGRAGLPTRADLTEAFPLPGADK